MSTGGSWLFRESSHLGSDNMFDARIWRSCFVGAVLLMLLAGCSRGSLPASVGGAVEACEHFADKWGVTEDVSQGVFRPGTSMPSGNEMVTYGSHGRCVVRLEGGRWYLIDFWFQS